MKNFFGYSKHQRSDNENSRNGYNTKTVRTDTGEVEINVPRDRKSEFEPQIVKKRQTVLSELEDKIVAMYSKGMTTRDIQEILSGMYGVENKLLIDLGVNRQYTTEAKRVVIDAIAEGIFNHLV